MEQLENNTSGFNGSFITYVATFLALFLFYFLRSMRSQKLKTIPPGPSGWPIVGNLLQLGSKPHISLTEMSKKYGNIFHIWFGSNLCVVLNDYDSIKKALSQDGCSGRIRGTLIDYFTQGKGLVMSEGDLWKEHRRFALSTLRDLGMGKSWLQDRILEDVELVIKMLDEQRSRPYDPEHLITNSVSNIICAAVFGKRFAYDDEDFAELLKRVREGLKSFGQSNLLVLYPFLRIFPYFHGEFLRMKVKDDLFFDFMAKIITEARKASEARGDDVSDYVNAFYTEQERQIHSKREKPSTFEMKQLTMSVANMFIAGTETTASTLLIGFLYMVENPEVMRTVQKELDTVAERHEPIRMEHRRELFSKYRHTKSECTPPLSWNGQNIEGRYIIVKSLDRPAITKRYRVIVTLENKGRLPYTEATILELLRLAAVAPLGVFHRTTEKITVNDYVLPKNTMIISNIYAAHHDSATWDNPDKFDPTRFLDETGKFVKSLNVIPFAVGKRACLGENLAQTELFLIFTNILHRFDLLVPDGNSVSSSNVHVGITISPNPYQLIFRTRL